MLLPRSSAAAATCACLVLTATAAHARPHADFSGFAATGRVVATPEKVDGVALKAAHRTLPFGSIVKVVNRRNGKSVVVEINDRARSKLTRRMIGLSPEAARELGMARRSYASVRLEVSPLTREELDGAFAKLGELTELRAEVEGGVQTGSVPLPLQIAARIGTEVTRPLATLGNIFKNYVESMIVAAGPQVQLTCPDGRPLPESLRAVLRRAAIHFDGSVEVISGYRSLSYNRKVYGNRHRAHGGYAGDGSQHINCKAADFRIAGVSAAALHAWALHQPELGGVGRYRGNFIHVDVRPRPQGRLVTWDWRGRKLARKHVKRYASVAPVSGATQRTE
jgi:rare lipoprotein A